MGRLQTGQSKDRATGTGEEEGGCANTTGLGPAWHQAQGEPAHPGAARWMLVQGGPTSTRG